MTRGRGLACTVPRPAAASRPRCTGPSRVPAVSSRSPGCASPPSRRTDAPAATGSRMVTCPVPPSVSSTGTTASAPAGQRRAGHDPEAGAGDEVVPAGVAGGDLAVDGQRDRRCAAAAATSAATHCVAVHGRVVERRQRALCGDVAGQDRAERVGERKLARRQRPDGGHDVGQVVLHRVHHGLPDVCSAVVIAAYLPSLWPEVVQVARAARARTRAQYPAARRRTG